MAERSRRADGVLTREQLTAALSDLEARGKHPTARELAQAVGVSHSNVRHHVEALQQQGVITVREVPAGVIRREIMLVRANEQRP